MGFDRLKKTLPVTPQVLGNSAVTAIRSGCVKANRRLGRTCRARGTGDEGPQLSRGQADPEDQPEAEAADLRGRRGPGIPGLAARVDGQAQEHVATGEIDGPAGERREAAEQERRDGERHGHDAAQRPALHRPLHRPEQPRHGARDGGLRPVGPGDHEARRRVDHPGGPGGVPAQTDPSREQRGTGRRHDEDGEAFPARREIGGQQPPRDGRGGEQAVARHAAESRTRTLPGRPAGEIAVADPLDDLVPTGQHHVDRVADQRIVDDDRVVVLGDPWRGVEQDAPAVEGGAADQRGAERDRHERHGGEDHADGE